MNPSNPRGESPGSAHPKRATIRIRLHRGRREAAHPAIFHQLDHYATGASVHLVANLKANYLAATSLYQNGGDRKSFSLIRNAETAIRAFLAKARLRAALFTPPPPSASP